MSLAAVNAALSGLKACQTEIGTGMDIVTSVAMDLAETSEGVDHSAISQMEALMLECAKMDREINHFFDTVQQVTGELNTQPPEAMFGLAASVKEQFEENIARLSDNELQRHQKVVAFKESIQKALNPDDPDDEDVAVTQSDINLTCPLTQVAMVNPMKNMKCNHHYDEPAILAVIKARHSQNKKCRCPVVGCGNTDVKQADLVPDQILKRMLQKRQSNSP